MSLRKIDENMIDDKFTKKVKDLSDNMKSVGEQLAETVKKGQLSVADIDRNKGKFDQTYMSDELLQQMAGNTPINAVPADRSITTPKIATKAVTPYNTTFMESNNLYKGQTNDLGLTPEGNYSANLGGYASGFHAITSDMYASKIVRVAFYDATQKFISRLNSIDALEKLSPPVNAKYFKFAVAAANIESAFITQSFKMSYKHFDEETFLDKFFDKVKAYNNNTVNNKGITVDGGENYNNLGGYGSDYIPVSPRILISRVLRVAFYDSSQTFISYINTLDIVGDVEIPPNAVYYRFSILKDDIGHAYVYNYRFKDEYINPKTKGTSASYEGYLGVQQFSLTIDDVIECFRDITNNKDTYTSIFENDFFNKCKMLHETYGLRMLCVVFYKSHTANAFDLSQTPTKFKEEFERNKHWLQFSFHSYATDVRYTDYSLPQPSGFILNRSLFDDYTLTRDVMLNVVGSAWTDEHTCFHYYDGRADDIKQLREVYGLSILDGIPYQIASRGYSYNISGQKFRQMVNNDVYKDEYTGVYYVLKDASVERVVGALTSGNDHGVMDMKTFLDNYNNGNIDYLQFETHEIYFNNQKVLDGFNEMCQWCVDRGYSNKFPQARDFWNY